MKTLTSIFFILFSYASAASAFTDPSGGTGGGGTVSLDPPITNANDPNLLIGTVIQAILGIVGSLALLMFVWGGLMWMLAAGNNERVQKGKDTLLWATIGLVVIFTSYAAVKFIFDSLGVK